MRLWQKWLLISLVPIILAVGAIAIYQYQVKASIEDFLQSMKPIARVSYDGLDASLSGHVSITNIKIQPLKYQNQITLDSLSFDLPSPLFVFTGKANLEQGILDSLFAFKLSGVRYDLEADYAESNRSESLGDREFCEQGAMDSRLLLSMGYQQLRGDMTLRLEPEVKSGLVRIELATQFQDFFVGQFDLRLAVNQGRLFSRVAMSQAGVKLVNFALTDSGYNSHWQEYCSAQLEQSKETLYALYHETLAVQLGLDKTQDNNHLLDLLVGTRAPGGQLAARLHVATPIPVDALVSLIGVDALLENAEFNLQINGKILDVTEADWAVLSRLLANNVRKAALVMTNKEAPQDVLTQKDVQPEMKEIIPGVMPIRLQEKVKAYHITPYEQLSSYVGSPIRLRTFFGNDMEGVLLSVSPTSLNIQHHVEQGRASFPVSKEKIASVEVYR